MNPLSLPMLRVVVESYLLTNWKNTSFMKSSLKQGLELLERFGEGLKEMQVGEDALSLLGRHYELYRELIEIVIIGEKQEIF